jgi:hypothetical protein
MCNIDLLEQRLDKPYDQQGTSKILLPGRPLVACGDRQMTNSLMRAALDLWREVTA